METKIQLKELGYNTALDKFRIEQKLDGFETGRVIAEHKERYIVKTLKGEFSAEITGNMRFTANSREDFPAVGDWVALITCDSKSVLIHKIFPRTSVLKRQDVGKSGEIQVIATNIDYAFILQSVDRDFNINRLERYLIICNSSKVIPILILTKIDLISDEKISDITEKIKTRIKNIDVIAISNETHKGYNSLKNTIEKGKTYCLLGSSGVGKSTLLNNLSGRTLMKTGNISESTNKGKHTTSHRELFILENGGILIDNPGMREIGITDATNGLETTFDSIMKFSQYCKFKDCTHTKETGCAVIEALQTGEIDHSSYENYLKMEKEKAHYSSTIAERRKKEKSFGKILKDYHKKDYKGKNLG